LSLERRIDILQVFANQLYRRQVELNTQDSDLSQNFESYDYFYLIISAYFYFIRYIPSWMTT
jgi:hypothetical protein